MADENIAKTCEKTKEKSVKTKGDRETIPPVNGKTSDDVVTNGNSAENGKSNASQKTSLTHSNKSLHTSKDASSSNHVAPKVEGKSAVKRSHETPSKDKKKHDEQGKISIKLLKVGASSRRLFRHLHESFTGSLLGHVDKYSAKLETLSARSPNS